MNTQVIGRTVVLLACGFLVSGLAQTAFGQSRPVARVFVQADGGFDLLMTAALEKKHLPVSVVTDKSQADFEVGATHSSNEAGVKLVDLKNGDVIFAYSAAGKSERRAEKTAAEACAEHMRSVVAARRALRKPKLFGLMSKDPAFDF
jgi:hypothetical protein